MWHRTQGALTTIMMYHTTLVEPSPWLGSPQRSLAGSEVPSGIHVVEVIPLNILQPQHRATGGQAHHPRPTTGPRPFPQHSPGGSRPLVMFSTTWRVMAEVE